MWSVQALALDPDTQLSLFPDFTDKAYELADDFDIWYGATKWRSGIGFNSDQKQALLRIMNHLNSLEPKFFTEQQVLEGPEWRELAQTGPGVGGGEWESSEQRLPRRGQRPTGVRSFLASRCSPRLTGGANLINPQ